jgi:hypothetical protein
MLKCGRVAGKPPVASAAIRQTNKCSPAPDFRTAYESAPDSDARRNVIDEYHNREPVQSEGDIRPDTLYFLHGKNKDYVLRTADLDGGAEKIRITNELSGKPLSQITKRDFLDQGRLGRMFLLAPKTPPSADSAPQDSDGDDVEPAQPPADAGDRGAKGALNDSAFNALLLAAGRRKFFPRAQEIDVVKTIPFREKRYDRALTKISELHGAYKLAAHGWVSELRQEIQRLEARRDDLKARRLLRDKRKELTDATTIITSANKQFNFVTGGLIALCSREQREKYAKEHPDD